MTRDWDVYHGCAGSVTLSLVLESGVHVTSVCVCDVFACAVTRSLAFYLTVLFFLLAVYVYVCVCVCVCVGVCFMHICMYVSMYIYTDIYVICIYIHMYIYIHTLIFV